MKKKLCTILTLFIVLTAAFSAYAADADIERLNKFAEAAQNQAPDAIGYPVTQDIPLHEFNIWYLSKRLDRFMINNAGDPFDPHSELVNTLDFEREVIEFFAPHYGIDKNEVWGICTFSGTDGNNLGIYFGAKYLENITGKKPIVYVSREAHYSNMRLCHLQNLEMKLIPTDSMGRMEIAEFEKVLDTTRPALVIIAMGTTFKGGIDNARQINAVLERKKPIAVYRHVDAALFGGYLPFTEHKDLLDARKNKFDSIAVSGHKFFGMNEPAGIFLTTKKVLEKQKAFNITYLNGNMPMINCSRSAITPLKFWWLTKKVGYKGYEKQAKQILENAKYLKQKLDAIGYPCWLQPCSNTVFFKRPSERVMKKWGLAPDYDKRLGGDLAHVVIMQHVSKQLIDKFVADIKKN